ncbi:MAG: metallophosphoesterase [Synergistaceae bacterium]|jgi:predicted MPP superfamily phosphohydrolase|nr:metallophosphoesterase [Synergistaceae bacterium]
MRLLFYLMGCAAAFHAYFGWKIYQGFGRGKGLWLYLAWTAPFVFFPVVRYFEWLGNGRASEVFFALTVWEYVMSGMVCSLAVLAEIARLLLWLWDKGAKTHKEDLLTPRRIVVFSLAAACCVAAYGVYEAWDVRTVHLVFASPKLPASVEKLRIVQISDIHIGGLYSARHLERVMTMVREAEPDIFVVTGDLVDGNMASREEEAELLSRHGAKLGAFAVTGNHEHYTGLDQALKFMERSGLTVLDDRAAEVAGITIVGLDDLTLVWPIGNPADTRGSRDRFVLLLRHRPHVIKTSRGKFDLQLSGHTHGGQLWPFGPLSERLQGYTQGLSRQGDSFVYVSNGTGFWGPPMRLLAPPEVSVIDLIPAEGEGGACHIRR